MKAHIATTSTEMCRDVVPIVHRVVSRVLMSIHEYTKHTIRVVVMIKDFTKAFRTCVRAIIVGVVMRRLESHEGLDGDSVLNLSSTCSVPDIDPGECEQVGGPLIENIKGAFPSSNSCPETFG